jgi:glycosyltransferase involved in cell wall biosynthesis
MHQKDISIVERSNIQTDAVIVNQCDQDKIEKFSFINKRGKECHVKFIYTTERGLSKSRNMALRNCSADICVLADDDECFFDDYEDKILSAYNEHPEVALIAFSLIRNDIKGGKKYPTIEKKLSFKQIFSTSSIQLTFKRSIDVFFDEKMGSGTGNGGGEENKFMFDVRRKNIKMWYVPSVIATVNPSDSQWFKGYDDQYFKNHGWASRRVLGSVLSLIYCSYFVFKTRKKVNLPFLSLIKYEFLGWLSKR